MGKEKITFIVKLRRGESVSSLGVSYNLPESRIKETKDHIGWDGASKDLEVTLSKLKVALPPGGLTPQIVQQLGFQVFQLIYKKMKYTGSLRHIEQGVGDTLCLEINILDYGLPVEEEEEKKGKKE